MRRIPLFLALGPAACLLAFALKHEASETNRAGEWATVPTAAGVEATLVSLDARAGSELRVAICVDGEVPSDAAPPTVALWLPASETLVYRAALEPRWFANGRCADVGRGEVERDGTYALVLVRENASLAEWPRVRAAMATSTPTGTPERAATLALFALLVLWAVTRGERPDDAIATKTATATPLLTLFAGLAAYALAFTATGFVPGGVLGVALRGVLLLGVGAAFGLASQKRDVAEAVRFLPLRVAAVVVASFAASFVAMRLAPPVTEAPVTAVFDVPSTRLAAVVVGAFAPIAEELFFRGFVQGALTARIGKLGGALASTAIFTAFHLPQTGLEPSAWLSIAALGLGLSWLYASTGTTRAGILAHVVHNALRTVR